MSMTEPVCESAICDVRGSGFLRRYIAKRISLRNPVPLFVVYERLRFYLLPSFLSPTSLMRTILAARLA